MDTTSEAAAQVVVLFQATGGFISRPQTNRHRSTSETDDRFIVSTSLRNRHLTGVDVQQEFRRVRGVAASQWKFRRRLKKANWTKRPETDRSSPSSPILIYS
ncbi:unnamed protein product [Euphydryas editha]|uniref:Uncharacterized protein n=1 Tax=Euphydryas editha TaxID=104508 RepID=A0AAU9TP79_EUPED|nr:unnamed protein product [Euphydryas editha]